MDTRKEIHWRITKTPSEESHPVNGPLGENSTNPVKNREKSVLKPYHIH